MVWPFKSNESERQRAAAVNAAIHSYYQLAKRRFPDKKDIFFLALAWAVYAKKHHASQYQSHDLSFLFVAGVGDTAIFSLLDSPDSIDALGLYMIHKETISVSGEFEPQFNKLMSKIQLSEPEAMRKAQEASEYAMEEAECLDGLTENDF